MKNFYLEEPGLSRELDVIDYVREHKKYGSNIGGSSYFVCILNGDTYYDCLIKDNNLSNEEYAEKLGMCPGKTYFMIRRVDNRIVGMINIRYKLNERMLRFGGNIGYGIRPTARDKDYNNILLYLGLKKAYEEFHLDKVMIDCPSNDEKSNKTITDLGGELERTELDPSNNVLVNVYWIDVKDSLEKNREKYA